jgi:hypothetical protein
MRLRRALPAGRLDRDHYRLSHARALATLRMNPAKIQQAAQPGAC